MKPTAHKLMMQHATEQNHEFAWLFSEGKLYSAAVGPTEAQQPGRSPIVRLIEGIYFSESKKEKSNARTLLRERIHSTLSPSITDLETVKVAAKRLAPQQPEITPSFRAELLQAATAMSHFTPTPFNTSEMKLGAVCDSSQAPALLTSLLSDTSRLDRKISAILVDAEERILAWSWNTSSVIRTQHAEWNLCNQTPIPRGAKLYVTLKPCRMCAARIWESADDPAQLNVIYLENDPGPLAQGTLLDAESPARRRLLGAKHPLYRHVIQTQMHID